MKPKVASLIGIAGDILFYACIVLAGIVAGFAFYYAYWLFATILGLPKLLALLPSVGGTVLILRLIFVTVFPNQAGDLALLYFIARFELTIAAIVSGGIIGYESYQGKEHVTPLNMSFFFAAYSLVIVLVTLAGTHFVNVKLFERRNRVTE